MQTWEPARAETPDASDTSSVVRILAIDRHVSVAEAFGRRLAEEDDFVFLGVLSDQNRAGDAVVRLNPDVCIVDLIFGDGHTGIRALREIEARNPSVRRLIVADVDGAGSALLAEAMACSPDGFFSTAEGLEDLVKAVRVVADGGDFVSADLVLAASTAHLVANLFSRGELRVLCALARFGNKTEAADTTFYSAETINTYVRRIRKRVAEFEGRPTIRLPDLVAWARHNGFHHVEAD